MQAKLNSMYGTAMQAEQFCGSELKYFGSADPVATFCHLGSGSNFKTVNKSSTNPVLLF